MSRTPSSERTASRRTVLATLAAAGVARATPAVVGARTSTDAAPDAPTVEPTGSLDLPGLAEAVVDDDGTTVYCSLGDGFGVVDVSDPSTPDLLVEQRGLEHDGEGPMERVMDVKRTGDRLVVAGPNGFAGGGLAGFFVYDVSDPASPERLAFQSTPFGIHNCVAADGHAYLTGTGASGSPVVIFDVSGDAPEEVGRWKAADADDAWAEVSSNYRQAHDVYVRGDTLYVAYWDAGTWLVDVSDPADPSARTRLGGHDVEYLASLGRNPTPEFFELPGNSHYVQPGPDGDRVFVGKEAWDRPDTDADGGPGGVELWDVSGSAPALRSVLRPPQPGPDQAGGWTSHNFGVRGDRLYTSWYSGGVRVYDVTDLADPRLLGEWRDPATTAFWTAKPLGEGFLGSSYVDPSLARENRHEGATLYTFPEPTGDGAVDAPTMARRAFPEPQGQDPTATPTPTPDPTPTATATATPTTRDPTATPTPTRSTADPSPTPTDGGGSGGDSDGGGGDDSSDGGGLPGFGALAALAGGGLGLWRLRRRRGE